MWAALFQGLWMATPFHGLWQHHPMGCGWHHPMGCGWHHAMDCGWHHPIGCDSELKMRRKLAERCHSSISTSWPWMQCNQHPLLLPLAFPTMVDYYLKLSQNNLSSNFVMHLVTATSKVQNKHVHTVLLFLKDHTKPFVNPIQQAVLTYQIKIKALSLLPGSIFKSTQHLPTAT